MGAGDGFAHDPVLCSEARPDPGGQDFGQNAGQIGFVERGGITDAIGQMTRRPVAVARKQVGAIGLVPAAVECKPKRRGEMVERHHWRDPACVASRNHRLVMVEHGDRKLPRLGLDSCPFQTEAIGVEAQTSHQIKIGRPQCKAVGRIARGFGIRCTLGMFGGPDIAADIVAFDLVRRGRCPPQKACGKRPWRIRSKGVGGLCSEPGQRCTGHELATIKHVRSPAFNKN